MQTLIQSHWYFPIAWYSISSSNHFLSLSCCIDFLRKPSEIVENIFHLTFIFLSFAENQENMIFTLCVFTKIMFFMQWISLHVPPPCHFLIRFPIFRIVFLPLVFLPVFYFRYYGFEMRTFFLLLYCMAQTKHWERLICCLFETFTGLFSDGKFISSQLYLAMHGLSFFIFSDVF